ncbi:hypothetical protein [Paenibacillus kribbensis]|uniref:hypothetical protein n=1 Tax=Paenibacillus kribbensis TaxID=172713 RepID=UPI000838326B|nr:hypothetical protein [Paenibacillus kribbensis]
MNKLELLNKIEIVETDGDGENLYYACADANNENIAILEQIGVPESEVIEMIGKDGEHIDISGFAWRYTPAVWFTGDEWIDYIPRDLKGELI